MRRFRDQSAVFRAGFLALACWTWTGHVAAAPTAPPSFPELYNVVRSNLAGASETELNQAAVDGFLGQLHGRVSFVTNAVPATDAAAVPLVSKTAVLDGAYALMRIGRVGAGLSNQVANAYDQLRSTNKLKGVVVDLRYAIGDDYGAAAETAALFPLLTPGNTTSRSAARSNAVELPLVLLVNHETTGAAEALAAALRQSDGSVIIGSPSAGHAYVYKEFPLKDGQTLRVATGSVLPSGDSEAVSNKGVEPDILVAANAEEEKAYFEDPYRTQAQTLARRARPGTNEVASLQSTNRLRHRLNEAELVRMQRDGLDLETEAALAGPVQPSGPVIVDPALSRAVDLLKGLALANKRR